MELELIKYQLTTQFNQHDSAIKNIMLNSGFKRQQFNDKGTFSIKKYNLGVSIKTINNEEGIFNLYFKDLMDLEKELGYPILTDLEDYAMNKENYFNKEVISLVGSNLIFKLESFLLSMENYSFSKDELEIIDEEIVFDLKQNEFRNPERIDNVLRVWETTRKYSQSAYVDMSPSSQLINSIGELIRCSEIKETVGLSVKNILQNDTPKIKESNGVYFINKIRELSMNK